MPIEPTFPKPTAFADRHIGPSQTEVQHMLSSMQLDSLDELIDRVVPDSIRLKKQLVLPSASSEYQALEQLHDRAALNQVHRTFIGRGYYDTVLPPVIQRNVLENPGWYTAYTPYQAEISQGRLEALLNFQTLITELTGLPVANASLLDEATAAAEAMAIANAARPKARRFMVSDQCFAQTIDVLRTRAEPIGIELEIHSDLEKMDFSEYQDDLIGVLLAYPQANGEIVDHAELAKRVTDTGGLVIVVADILALTLLQPPGKWGADIVVGSAQRFGVPMGYGGPHAAFISCSDKHKRRLPGRLVGVSRDSEGRSALRLSLQTREQHIRREKATSNICTAQVLLAVISGFYAIYHGRQGLQEIALNIANATATLSRALESSGYNVENTTAFDTLSISGVDQRVLSRAKHLKINLRIDDHKAGNIGLSLDEAAIESGEWKRLAEVFELSEEAMQDAGRHRIPEPLLRDDQFLTQPVFNAYRTESQMMRYLRRLEGKDIALNWSMIPLGSCTMKLNATSEMLALSWPNIGRLHPFTPVDQAKGYQQLARELETWLAEITGFAAVSLQPNAGSQGEYAGLLAIRRFHLANDDKQRNICLIPTSAHGTNPASAVMCGMKVVPIQCDSDGNIDVDDVRAKASELSDRLAALMVTYPSTHGVFETEIQEICEIVHSHGGQIYLDGANMNAQVGLCSPGTIGADVCHLNLHKTFCIPHGGGGPGVGPIGVAMHLKPFLPGHRDGESSDPSGVVSAAPLGSASILTISWMYIAMMSAEGLTYASKIAILSANYMAHRLQPYFPVLYRGANGQVAHECIIDLRPIRERTGIDVEDVAKRLIDFGFHAPTMSWPVAGTLMIEPTESEDLAEIDRFCEAMIAIYAEIESIEAGELPTDNNPLTFAPHPAADLLDDSWDRAYSREQAAYPLEWVKERKFWPPVSRIDNVHGDRNLVCTCEGMEAYAKNS